MRGWVVCNVTTSPSYNTEYFHIDRSLSSATMASDRLIVIPTKTLKNNVLKMMIESGLFGDFITVTVHHTDRILLCVPHTDSLHLGLHLASLLGHGGGQHHHQHHQPAAHLQVDQVPLKTKRLNTTWLELTDWRPDLKLFYPSNFEE